MLETNHDMKTWTFTAGWHIMHGKLLQQFARLTSNDRWYEQGKEEEMVGRLQRGLHLSEEKILNLLHRNHGQWRHS